MDALVAGSVGGAVVAGELMDETEVDQGAQRSINRGDACRFSLRPCLGEQLVRGRGVVASLEQREDPTGARGEPKCVGRRACPCFCLGCCVADHPLSLTPLIAIDNQCHYEFS